MSAILDPRSGLPITAGIKTHEQAADVYRTVRTTLVARGWTAAQVAEAFDSARSASLRAAGRELTWQEIAEATASLLKRATPPTAPAPVAPAPVSIPADGKTISAVAKARVQSVTGALAASGFTSRGGRADDLRATVVKEGTRVVQLGEDNYRTIHAEVKALPLLPSFVRDVSLQVAGEQRQDHTVHLGYLAVNDEAAILVGPVGPVLWPTKSSLRQLGATLGFSDGVDYLWSTASTYVRAEALRDHLTRTQKEPTHDRKGNANGTRSSDKIVLRTLQRPNGKRVIYGQVTEKYTPVDTDTVLGCVLEALGPDVHVEGNYSEGRGRVTAIYMADTVLDLAAGDVFKSGVTISWDDRGTGSITIRGVAWRNLCLNLIIVDKAVVEIARLAHKGSRDEIVAEMKDGIAQALDSIAPVLQAYGIARTTKLEPVTTTNEDGVETTTQGVESLLRTLVNDGTLGLPRRSQAQRDASVQALLAAWKHEPGDTLADAVNAVTRAAHEVPEFIDFRSELERIASTLLPVVVRQ